MKTIDDNNIQYITIHELTAKVKAHHKYCRKKIGKKWLANNAKRPNQKPDTINRHGPTNTTIALTLMLKSECNSHTNSTHHAKYHQTHNRETYIAEKHAQTLQVMVAEQPVKRD